MWVPGPQRLHCTTGVSQVNESSAIGLHQRRRGDIDGGSEGSGTGAFEAQACGAPPDTAAALAGGKGDAKVEDALFLRIACNCSTLPTFLLPLRALCAVSSAAAARVADQEACQGFFKYHKLQPPVAG
jgi:hypothetical protein